MELGVSSTRYTIKLSPKVLTNSYLDELGISCFDELGISFIRKISSKKVASFDSMIIPTSISGTLDFTIKNLYPMLWKA
jgi:hypothetical protein